MNLEPPTTSDILIAKYRPLLSERELAEIFGKHVQTLRKMRRAGRLPFANVSLTDAEYQYRLADVLAYLENPLEYRVAQQSSSAKRRGRPVGSRNRQTAQEVSHA